MTLNLQPIQEKNIFKEDLAFQQQSNFTSTLPIKKIQQNFDNGGGGGSGIKQVKQSSAIDQTNKSRSKILEGQKQVDQGEDEEFNAKFALLDAETTPSNHNAVLKAQNLSKKKSLDSWDQEDPGFTDVRSFGNTLSGFKSKQFYQGNHQYPNRNGSNYNYRFGNRSNFHFGGGGGSSRYQINQNSRDNVGGLYISTMKQNSKQLPSVPLSEQQNQPQPVSQSLQINNQSILNKPEDQLEQKGNIINPTHNANKVNENKLITEGNISDEDEDRNSQGLRSTSYQFQKWEKKEQRGDSYLNTTKKKYGLATSTTVVANTSVVQMPQTGLHNYHFTSVSNIQPLGEMKIYGNSFNSLKKEKQDQSPTNQNDISLPIVAQSKLKKIDLNTNLQLPNQSNSQILFPSSLNINLHISNNQQLIEQQQQSTTQRQKLSYKYQTNIPKVLDSDQTPKAVQETQFNSQNQSMNENHINFPSIPQMEANDQKIQQDHIILRKENLLERTHTGIQHKQIQIFNMDSLRITPIHSERIYHQVEPESDLSPLANGRIIDMNSSSQLKSKSLSPLRFPKHRAIPPMRMKYKKKEKDDTTQYDSSGVQNSINGIGGDDILQQNQLLLIKNIKPNYKIVQAQQQLTVPNTNIHSPTSNEQFDHLLNIISPSLYPPISPTIQKASIKSPRDLQDNQNINNQSDDQLIEKNDKGNILLNLPGDNPKMKIFSLKFNGHSSDKNLTNDGNPVTTILPNQKFVKQKQNLTPRLQSPRRSMQNQQQNGTTMPPLIVHQFHNQGQQYINQLKNKSLNSSPNKREQANYFHQTIENLSQQNIQKNGQNNLNNNSSFISQNQHHLDFVDYVQGKSANIAQKQLQSDKKSDDEIKNKQENESNQKDNQNQVILLNSSSVIPSSSYIKKVSSASKFADRKVSPNLVRKVKTAFMPNSQSQTQLSLNTSFSNQGNNQITKATKFVVQSKNPIKFSEDQSNVIRGSSLTKNKQDPNHQFVITNSYKQQQQQQQEPTNLRQEQSKK